jgi:hypothetical protein
VTGVFGPHFYARGKMGEVTRAMATGTGSAQDRVYDATGTIQTALGEADFPPKLRQEFTAILADVAPHRLRREGERFVNGKRMTSRTAGKLLSRIWDLEFDLLEATDEKGFQKP